VRKSSSEGITKTIQTLIVFCVLSFTLKAQVSFKLSSSPGVSNDPNSVTAADVNGDGKLDLICADYYGNAVTVLTNNGSGGFVLSGTYGVGIYPGIVVAANVNGDGKVDLICVNQQSSTLSVLTNNGSGGFVLASSPVVGNGPTSVTAADVNGNGKVDLISANWNSNTGNTLSVLTNNGSGGFVLASSPVTGKGPNSVAAADINGDGKLDLISANRADSTVSVLTNNGSGGFVLAGTYPVGNAPYFVAAADVNGDGKLDLITANYGEGAGNTLTVLTNNGSGIFGSNATINVGNAPICVAATDVNGDGKVDLISANNKGNSLSILTNNGSGGFVLATNLSVGSGPNWVTAADVNGDGRVDLISANGGNNTLSVLTNATVFPMTLPIPAPSGLVAWWRAEGNANDSAGTNNGTASNITYTNGEVGQAFHCTASTIRIVDGPAFQLTNALTIEGWVRPGSDGSYEILWRGDDRPGLDPYLLSMQGNNNIVFGICDANNNTATVGNGVNIPYNQWTHVAGTFDGSVGILSLYTNGILAAQVTTTIRPMAALDPSQDPAVCIGSINNGGFQYHGDIDELSLYSRALASNEIAAIYNADSAGKYIASSVPIITSQPQSQTNFVGATVTFQVGATSSIPVSYQWRKNSTKLVDGDNLSGTHTNALTIINISYSDAAIYSVIVSNTNGSVTSSNAVLTVIPPRTATGIATLTGGFVTGLSITDGGGGYTNTPLVRFIGGGGSGVGAYAVVSNGVVTSITVTNAGYGYTNAPLVVIDPPFILNPVLGIAPMSFLSFSNLTVGGTYQLQQSLQWYWTNRTSGFMASNAVYTQMVGSVAGGGNYRLAVSPVPAQAFATPQVVNGFVVGATVTSGGSGYVTSPAVSVVGGGGTGATAVASISSGVVTGIQSISTGSGYTNTPTVEIAPPPATAVSPTVLPGMRVDSANLAPYDNYQIQFKPDMMAGWMNWDGGLFSPTAVTNSQFLFITNTTGFFRLQYMP
jgi:hypothetical protein